MLKRLRECLGSPYYPHPYRRCWLCSRDPSWWSSLGAKNRPKRHTSLLISLRRPQSTLDVPDGFPSRQAAEVPRARPGEGEYLRPLPSPGRAGEVCWRSVGGPDVGITRCSLARRWPPLEISLRKAEFRICLPGSDELGSLCADASLLLLLLLLRNSALFISSANESSCSSPSLPPSATRTGPVFFPPHAPSTVPLSPANAQGCKSDAKCSPLTPWCKGTPRQCSVMTLDYAPLIIGGDPRGGKKIPLRGTKRA